MCWAVTGPAAGQFGLFDPTAAGACDTSSPAGTNPVYVDLAVLRTAAAGNFAGKYVGAGVDKLTPDHGILSALLGPNGYDNGHANLAVDPALAAVYANGNRKPSPFVPGFTTLIDTAATSDEGGNFIDIRYGPLTLWNCLNPDGTVKPAQSAANCPLFGNYHLAAGSPAVDSGAARTGANGVPVADFDGDARPAAAIDIGADELASAPPPPVVLPALALLDNFNRANSNTLGPNWTQLTLFGQAAIRVNTNQAFPMLSGNAYWNTVFGAKQAAAFTLIQVPANGTSLLLKASGGVTFGAHQNFVRVRYSAGSILVETTTSFGASYANLRTLATGVTFAAGETMAAMCDAAGNVTAWKIPVSGPPASLGQVSLPVTGATAFVAGSGRIGIQLPAGSPRVDDMRGGTVP
jgi:hypothetical protein